MPFLTNRFDTSAAAAVAVFAHPDAAVVVSVVIECVLVLIEPIQEVDVIESLHQ